MEKYVPYRAYLIRIWETRRGGVAGYRAVAVDIATRERKDFPNLESLFTFLRTQGDDWCQNGLEDVSDRYDNELPG